MNVSLIFAIFAALVVTETESRAPKSADMFKDKTVQELVQGIEQFSISFLLRSSLSSKIDNIVVSPYSAWSSLTLMCKGAKGDTLDELIKVLRHPRRQYNQMKAGLEIVENAYDVDSYDVDIKSRNFIFTDLKVSSDFERSITPTCNTYVISTKFQDPNAHRMINQQFSAATGGELNNIVYQNDLTDSQIVLANAMYFKTTWTQPFNSIFTSKKPFYDHTNKQIGVVDMMMQKGRFKYASVDSFQADVIEMQIGDKNRMCMLTLMPYENVELSTIYNSFLRTSIGEIFDALEKSKNHYHEVELQYPKFTTTTDIVLNEILNHMGIYDLFDPKYADLTGIIPSKNISLSRVIHLAKMEVIEGSENDFAFESSSRFDEEVPQFVVNRPFLYLIIEKETNVVVLGGTFKNPNSS